MKEDEYQELALEIIDMLGVAFHFAGAKKQHIEELIDIYINEIGKFDDNQEFNQSNIIEIINQIKLHFPHFFIKTK